MVSRFSFTGAATEDEADSEPESSELSSEKAELESDSTLTVFVM